ncbi:MAG: hypothetical protein WCG27_05495 [Pseudomonadota bacterium]
MISGTCKFILLFVVILGSYQLAWGEQDLNEKYPTISVEKSINYRQNWNHLGSNDYNSLQELFKILLRCDTGKKILTYAQKKASRSGKTLQDIIEVGEHSTTDTTLVRRFFPDHPEEVVYEERSQVTINRDLTISDAVLDLAHELTHFTFRTPFNPYQKNFSIKDLITNTIEGSGGEADAYVMECTVWKELFSNGDRAGNNCHKIVDERSGRFSKDKTIALFYRLGPYLETFKDKIKNYKLSEKDFPFLGGQSTLFVSSLYNLPYPLAALEEYLIISKRACTNDRKRLQLMSNNIGRLPASLRPKKEQSYQKMTRSYEERCHTAL